MIESKSNKTFVQKNVCYQISRAVSEIGAAGDRWFVEVHGVGILEARVARSLQVDHHQVVLQQNDYRVRVLRVCNESYVKSKGQGSLVRGPYVFKNP